MAYGEERLGLARELKYLVIVEGESDAWTLWQHDLPALGIPGVNSTRVLNESHVRGVDRVYIVREPDQPATSSSRA